MAEKTEKATPKKLRDARKKGQVAKSKDFPAAFTFVTSFILVVVTAGFFFQQLAGYMMIAFKSIRFGLHLSEYLPTLVAKGIEVILMVSLPFLIIVSIVGVLVNFLIIGPLFSMEAMKPDIKRLNPVTNLKGIFKLKTFVELLKSVAKIIGAVILIYSVIYDSLPEVIATASLPVLGSAIVFSDFLVRVVVRVGIFFLVVAVFDLVFQKKTFAKEMKMEKFDLKQELKDTEGNPEIKGKRRQVQQEIAYQEGPMATMRAKAVVTNPTQIAVAVEYEAEKHPAPKIIVMGQGILAENIVAIAQSHHIPIWYDRSLARALFYTGKAGQYVPEDTYEAIAEMLKWLQRLEAEKEASEYSLEIFK